MLRIPSKRVNNLLGKTFNRLTIIEFVGYKKSKCSSSALWKCLCNCGNIKIIEGRNLTHGRIKSCGCLTIEKTKERQTLSYGQAAFNKVYGNYKNQIKKYGDTVKESF